MRVVSCRICRPVGPRVVVAAIDGLLHVVGALGPDPRELQADAATLRAAIALTSAGAAHERGEDAGGTAEKGHERDTLRAALWHGPVRRQ